MSNDRITEIKEQLQDDDLSSHKRDQLKRELNKLRSQQDGNGGVGIHRTVGIALVAVLFVGGIGYALASSGIIQLSVDNTDNSNNINASMISTEGQPVLGDPDAPVTMVMYEDFQCPVCQRFESSIKPRVESDYVENGDVKIVWKDMPLAQIHDWAESAAAAQECVYRQDNDAFWAVTEKIFENQNSLNTGNVQHEILTWAAAEGVSENEVQACLDNGDPMDAVRADYNEGRNLGVSGTPTVFIDGLRLSGLRPYGEYQRAIETATNN